MNILLFGGSFNPPHLGHLIVLEQAAELIPDIDEIWLLPTYNHLFGKDLISATDRLAMCRAIIQNPKVKLCPIEIDYHTSGSTYETTQLLKTEKKYLDKTMFPDFQSPDLPVSLTFSFLMGSDQLPTFGKWDNWEKLLEEMHFYVYPRGSHRHDVTYPNMTLLTSPTQIITNISSTLIRDRLRLHLPVNHILPPAVADYIQTHHLYQ